MTTAAGSTTVHDYLARLRAELADLPQGEVEDILDDVGVQLAESGDELDRLGSPRAYAAELRAAAGYPSPPEVTAGGTGVPLRPRLGVWLLGAASVAAGAVGAVAPGAGSRTAVVLALVVLVGLPAVLGWFCVQGRTGLRVLPEVVAARAGAQRVTSAAPVGVRDLVVSLRPAWWVLRAGLAAVLVTTVVGLDPSTAVLGVLSAAFVVPSVWLARRSQRVRAWAWVSVPLNVLAVGVLLSLPSVAGSYAYASATSEVSADTVTDFASLPAYNVYPFDAAGNPLTGVYLFDQDGQPIRLYANPCYDGSYENTSGQENGSNAYPLPDVVNDPQTGRCVTVPGVPFTALLPRASVTPAAAPTAAPTTAPAAAPLTPSRVPSPSSGVGSAPTTPAATTAADPTG